MEIEEYLNKIICGDCVEVMKKLPEDSIDLVITSPPYNIGIQYDIWNDRMKWKEYFLWCEKWLKEIYRIIKDDGRICINHYISFGSGNRGFKIGKKKGTEQGMDSGNGIRVAPLCEINTIAQKIGFKHHALVVWQDITLSRKTAWGSWLSASSPYINCPFEGILIFYKKKWKKENKGISTIDKREFIDLTRGIWKIPTERKQLTKANFHTELPRKCIKLLSYENDLVLDPFIGSGTTAIAAKELNRKFIGIEISPKYCKIAEDRIRAISNPLWK